jgi:hypothetical protein
MGGRKYQPGHPEYVPPNPAKEAAKAKANAKSDAKKAKRETRQSR